MNRCFYTISLATRLMQGGFVDPSNDAEYFVINAKVKEAVFSSIESENSFKPLIEDILSRGYKITAADVYAAESIISELNEIIIGKLNIVREQFSSLGLLTDIKCEKLPNEFEENLLKVLAVLVFYAVEISDSLIRYRSSIKSPLRFSEKFTECLENICCLGLNSETMNDLKVVLVEMKALRTLVGNSINADRYTAIPFIPSVARYEELIELCLAEMGKTSFLDKLKQFRKHSDIIINANSNDKDNQIIESVVGSLNTFYFQEDTKQRGTEF